MRIQHNIMAMNAYRNYNNNTSALSKNLEKLSSGYRINRAGDDAAGLAISEKMRAQITGLQAASKNVKDGVSLVKTAEGALQEVHDMLNRMDSLATQSANGTYDNEVDRLNLQKEVTALKSEIDRIADVGIAPAPGPEVITGSTRMKSGTAQKMVLNMLSTGTMIKLGKVYGNLMVDVKPSNEKLVRRCVTIVCEATGVGEDEAVAALEKCGYVCKQAIVMLLRGVDAPRATEMLNAAGGRVAAALEEK